jgi:hypothetical protein
VITPLAATEIGSLELAWFAFGVGMVFWLALLPLMLHRVLLYDHPLPAKLLPTLAIFVAPSRPPCPTGPTPPPWRRPPRPPSPWPERGPTRCTTSPR